MKTLACNLLRVVLAFVLLFAIGLATRIPAICWSGSYAAHGLYASFFYALLYSFALARSWPTWTFALGCLGYGLALAGMHPVMGIAAIVPLGLSLIVRAATKNINAEVAAISTAAVFAASVYPVTLLAGIVFGSCSIDSEGGMLQVAIMTTLAIFLSVLGSLLGTFVASRGKPRPAYTSGSTPTKGKRSR